MNNLAKQSEFDSLKAGILLAYQNKRNREPEYEAIYYLSKKSSSLSKMNQYASDIEKIIREINFTQSLLELLPEESYLRKLNIMPEDYILYHQGYFLELIHQMKDKLLRLIDAFSKIDEEVFDEPKKIIIGKVLIRPKIAQHPDLIKLIREWNQEFDSGGINPIAVMLNNRTNNHHFRSNLALASSYQDIKLSRLFTNLQTQQNILSDYGVNQMKLKGEEGFKKWHEDTKEKIVSTKKYVTRNLEAVSRLLRVIFNLPTLYNEKGKKISNYINYNHSTKELIAQTSLEKLKKTGIYYITAKGIELTIRNFISDQVISYYVIGSAARGEAKLGMSDLNLVIVTKKEMPGLAGTIRQSITDPQLHSLSTILIDIDVQILTKEQFLHQNYFKTAFLCRYDGVLIMGEDLANQKKYPLPGLGLAYLLNRDFKNNVRKTKEYLNSNSQLSNEEIMKIVRKTVKDSLWIMFGEVMANYVVYTADRKKIKELLIWAHPDEWRTVATLFSFLRGNVLTDRFSLDAILDNLCIEKLFPLLDDLENKAKNWFVDWQKNY